MKHATRIVCFLDVWSSNSGLSVREVTGWGLDGDVRLTGCIYVGSKIVASDAKGDY
jgi:hypothetical protein